MDFVEICNVYTGKMIIKAANRVFNSGEICRSYSDLNFGVTFFGTQCRSVLVASHGRPLEQLKPAYICFQM